MMIETGIDCASAVISDLGFDHLKFQNSCYVGKLAGKESGGGNRTLRAHEGRMSESTRLTARCLLSFGYHSSGRSESSCR